VHAGAPIHVSNVAVVDPDKKVPTRVKIRVETVERDGRPKAARTRVAVRSGKDL
jgi:large subunit ribosomal protein L24